MLPEVKNLSKKNKGFTLIELLVVIAIISVLSSLLLANFIGVRQRARDAQRKSDIEQIRAALELYRADNGTYPATPWVTSAAGDSWISALVPNYMSKVPKDPLNNGAVPWTAGGYTYAYWADAWCTAPGGTYILAAQLENKSDPKGIGSKVNAGGTACLWDLSSVPGGYATTNP